MPAPIVLFVYNRLDCLRRVVSSLQNNDLARDSELHIFSDGSAGDDDVVLVDAVRAYARTIEGFKKIFMVERSINWGLSKSIISGVTEVIEKYGEGIVLEDDIVVSPHFLRFMNEGLARYRYNETVMSLHAYVYPVRSPLPETYLLKDPGCWGWATWKRGWELFEPDGRKLLANLECRGLTKAFDYNGTYPFTQMLREQVAGKNDSWAIRFKASAFLSNKLTLYPGRSLATHIGEEGFHFSPGGVDYGVAVSNTKINLREIAVKESGKALAAYAQYFRETHGSKYSFSITNMRKKLSKIRNVVVKYLFKLSPLQGHRMESLKFQPTSESGSFLIGGYRVSYTNPVSFYYEWVDIFRKNIYHFRSETSAPVIVDAGGCIGMSALYFKLIYPASKILVFEPDPNIYAVLAKNVSCFADVQLVNAGLGKTTGDMRFSPDGSDGGRILPDNSKSVAGSSVKVVRLSEYLNSPVDLLKMNIEGMEGDVFEDIEPKLRLVKQIIFEYHAFHDLPQNLGKILQILDRNGFSYVVTDATSSKTPVPFNMPSDYKYFNLVYAKNKNL